MTVINSAPKILSLKTTLLVKPILTQVKWLLYLEIACVTSNLNSGTLLLLLLMVNGEALRSELNQVTPILRNILSSLLQMIKTLAKTLSLKERNTNN